MERTHLKRNNPGQDKFEKENSEKGTSGKEQLRKGIFLKRTNLNRENCKTTSSKGQIRKRTILEKRYLKKGTLKPKLKLKPVPRPRALASLCLGFGFNFGVGRHLASQELRIAPKCLETLWGLPGVSHGGSPRVSMHFLGAPRDCRSVK